MTANKVETSSMKTLALLITLTLLGGFAVGTQPGGTVAFAQKRDKEEKKKDPPGPPVIKDKGRTEKPKEPPRKDKKPA